MKSTQELDREYPDVESRANSIVVVVQHPGMATLHESYGRLPETLENKGYKRIYVCPMAGQKLPETMEGFAGLYVDGGIYSLNDHSDQEGIGIQCGLIEDTLRHEVPLLGVCLGSSLLARVLGAEVYRHPSGLGECGYRLITPTEAGKWLIPEPMYGHAWHREGPAVAAGATLLAKSELFNHAYVYGGRSWGLQFHPEVTARMLRRWLLIMPPEDYTFPGADAFSKQVQDSKIYDAGMADWFDNFVDVWLQRKTELHETLGKSKSEVTTKQQ